MTLYGELLDVCTYVYSYVLYIRTYFASDVECVEWERRLGGMLPASLLVTSFSV